MVAFYRIAAPLVPLLAILAAAPASMAASRARSDKVESLFRSERAQTLNGEHDSAFSRFRLSASCSRALKTAPLAIATDKGDFHFQVEVADTPPSRERGLMFRKSLAPDRGMLFDFKSSQVVAFWMKNTLIPLDMLFIGADGRIVSIARGARPMDETAIPSGGPVLGVLELKGGRATEIDAQPGDRVHEAIFPR